MPCLSSRYPGTPPAHPGSPVALASSVGPRRPRQQTPLAGLGGVGWAHRIVYTGTASTQSFVIMAIVHVIPMVVVVVVVVMVMSVCVDSCVLGWTLHIGRAYSSVHAPSPQTWCVADLVFP